MVYVLLISFDCKYKEKKKVESLLTVQPVITINSTSAWNNKILQR